MATTSPDNIKSPNAGDQYALVQDLGALADTVQAALVRRANSYKGTTAARIAFTSSATEGTEWRDTNGDKFSWVMMSGVWARMSGQKILASGNSFMNAGTTWNLSESVQAQPTGILLVWSRYSADISNAQFTTDFIPKAALAAVGNGFGWAFRPGLAGTAAKYLYLYNNSITGYEPNSVAPNNSDALRYVIGL